MSNSPIEELASDKLLRETFGGPTEREISEWDSVCPQDCWAREYRLEKPQLNESQAVSYTPAIALEKTQTQASSLYHPLKPWQTRILCLEPGLSGEPLVAELMIVDLIYFEGVVLTARAENVLYEALSYSWGYPEFTHSLKLNGFGFAIAEAVASALECLRHSDKQRYLWVDAICINQNDNAEKSAQVRSMLAIYRKASKVVAWIGDKLNSGFDAFDYLKDAPSEMNQMIHSKECLPGLKKMHTDIQQIFDRPWFRRTWVRQEVFAARKLEVQYGRTNMTWEQLMNAGKRLEQIELRLRDSLIKVNDPGLGRHKTLPYLKQATQQALFFTNAPDVHVRESSAVPNQTMDEVDLMSVVGVSSRFEATNDRDLVYGILGMTDTITRTTQQVEEAFIPPWALTIDYDKSVSQVFQDAARYLINRDKRLEVLYLADHSGGHGNLPSWTPDWRRTTSLTRCREIFVICRELERLFGSWPPSSPVADEDGQLQIHGISLQAIKPTVALTSSSDSQNKQIQRILKGTGSEPKIRRLLEERLRDGCKMVEAPDLPERRWLVPKGSSDGDLFSLVYGSWLPVILRRSKGKNRYKWIGPALPMSLGDRRMMRVIQTMFKYREIPTILLV